MFDAFYFKTLFSAKNEIRVEMTITNQCTEERNQLFPSLMKNFKPINIAVFFKISIIFISYH